MAMVIGLMAMASSSLPYVVVGSSSYEESIQCFGSVYPSMATNPRERVYGRNQSASQHHRNIDV
ncbi:unnamed protein product [Brassica rapa subsp. narinosa]